jgi:hypothetical protein
MRRSPAAWLRAVGLLLAALATQGCLRFAVGEHDGSKQTETGMSMYDGYFDGGPARDYRFRGAGSRGSPDGIEGKPPLGPGPRP